MKASVASFSASCLSSFSESCLSPFSAAGPSGSEAGPSERGPSSACKSRVYRGYSKLRTHPAIGPYGRSIYHS